MFSRRVRVSALCLCVWVNVSVPVVTACAHTDGIRGADMEDPLDVCFSMWDESRSMFCSEDFHVGVDDPRSGIAASAKMRRSGMGDDDGSGSHATMAGVRLKSVFRDVSRRLLASGKCFIVCTVFRRGALLVRHQRPPVRGV